MTGEEKARVGAALNKCIALIDDMSRFIGSMSLRDYALFNEAPIAAKEALAALQGPSSGEGGEGIDAIISTLRREQERLDAEDYIMDTNDCINVIREFAAQPKPHPTPAAATGRDVEGLLPCPFCGGEANWEHLESGRWSVGCTDLEGECMGFQTLQTFARKQDATVAWNTRAALSPPSDPDVWQPIETAPYKTVVRVRAGDMTFLARLEPDASMSDLDTSCDQWQAAVEGEHPRCWSGGC